MRIANNFENSQHIGSGDGYGYGYGNGNGYGNGYGYGTISNSQRGRA